MRAVKVGVREFREQIAHYLESDTPVAVTRWGETLGVYVPPPRKGVKSATAELSCSTKTSAFASQRPPTCDS